MPVRSSAMAIWIRTVDPKWFDFVSSEPGLAEINLWAPAGGQLLVGAKTGDLVLFRVAGRRGIRGYGLFFNAAIYFAADAWDLFGKGNGAATRHAFAEQIRARRTAKGSSRDPLGCHDIVEPVYFASRHHGLPEEAVRGFGVGPIDEESEDGKLIMKFLNNARSSPASAVMDALPSRDRAKRRQAAAGRSGFRMAVHSAYDRTCAVTGSTVLPTLEAVHVIADRFDGPMDVRNALLLRRDFHPLFEQGYMTIDDDHTVLFSKQLPRYYPHCGDYLAFHRHRLRLPKRRDLWPDTDLLAQHRADVFFSGGPIDG